LNCYFNSQTKALSLKDDFYKIVYYVMRSKNEVLCAAAGRLAAERSEADKPAKVHNSSLFNEF
jgi:hypothetical protein